MNMTEYVLYLKKKTLHRKLNTESTKNDSTQHMRKSKVFLILFDPSFLYKDKRCISLYANLGLHSEPNKELHHNQFGGVVTFSCYQ